MHFYSIRKSKSQIRHFIIPQEIFNLNQATINNFSASTISMTSVTTTKARIGCMLMLLNSFGVVQDFHEKTSKYGVWESKSQMGVLQ